MRVEPLDRCRWLELTAEFDDLNYRQCWDFGVACAEQVGARSEHIAVLDGDEIVALADVRVKTVPVLGGGIAYVNGGPLVGRSDGASSRLDAALGALTEEYVERRGLVLRVAPAPASADWAERLTEVFVARGFELMEPPDGTILIDLEPPLDELRKGFKKKWRYYLTKSEKAGLEVRAGRDPELFESFIGLFDHMIERKGFGVNLHPRLYADVQREAAPGAPFLVALAELDGEPVAGHVSSLAGDTAVYLLGASEGAGLDTYAAYLLQWYVIETAKAAGCRWYDLGGIDPEGNPGVYHFKKGMGGVDVRPAGPFERSARGLKARVTGVGEKLFRAVRSRRR